MNAKAVKSRREAKREWDGTMHRCHACYRTMPSYEFGRNRTKPNGLQSVCRECKNADARARYHNGNTGPKGRAMSREDAQARAVASFLFRMEGKSGTGCIDWPTQTVDRHGYGQVVVKDDAGHNHAFGTHRLAWVAEYGNIPDGMQVRHRCRRPICVNVNHLELGTIAENKADARWHDYVAKRAAAGEPLDVLAREYSTLPSVIFAIVTGSTWDKARRAA